MTKQISEADYKFRRYSEGRLIGLRVNRYSWWTHWRELADYFLPRRYKWIVTPNQMARGSPINQHILDSSGCIFARNLASGLVSGKSSPTRPWFKLKIGRLDSTQTSPVSLWLAECERILYREFTMTISAAVNEFGIDNVSENIRRLYLQTDGANLTREIIVAHSIEPNDDGKAAEFGFSDKFTYREAYWEWGGSASPQGGASSPPGFLRKRGYYEQPNICARWDLVSNDPYGRSPAMDGLPDQKQLQLESRRKAQAIDKMVNPPLVADVQLKNQPASLLPGGITYVSGYTASGKPGMASVYDTKFPVAEITEDLNECKERLKKIFFNDVLNTASQYETRSNVTAVEWDMRKSESLVMLGPALERIDNEGLKPTMERVFAIAARAGIFPPAPAEIAGKNLDIEFVSMLQQAQQATAAAGIERMFAIAGNIAGIDS